MAGTVASERQLAGIINLDDGFKVASSVERLSSLDPKQAPVKPESTPQSSLSALFAISLKSPPPTQARVPASGIAVRRMDHRDRRLLARGDAALCLGAPTAADIPGIDEIAATMILIEVGHDMGRYVCELPKRTT